MTAARFTPKRCNRRLDPHGSRKRFGFEKVFSRQVEAVGRKGDVLVAISTSGNSENIIQAIAAAKERGIVTVGFGGRDGGRMAKLVDIPFIIDSPVTARIRKCMSSPCIYYASSWTKSSRRITANHAIKRPSSSTATIRSSRTMAISMIPDAIVFHSGRVGALSQLQQAGFLLFVMTNQSGIGRGYFPESDTDRRARKDHRTPRRERIRIEKIYYCPHAPEENCPCRKPKPFLILKAAQEFGI